ncbi:MAG TPA: YgiQ family radical SAM protein [bacterium]|nr:YgiQ family radical SAM protein [bacterium]HRQ70728.1 YgiQ family radical SAM protein [bacterium]
MFIPATVEELEKLGWDECDIILVTGDAYIDSPYSGIAIIGHILIAKGYRVGIISQPDMKSGEDIMRLGEPLLFWGLTSGCVDSMVSNYTALKKRRSDDDLTPGGVNDRRPDRALIVYTGLIRRFFKNTVPIVLGGIEASLRRIAHYDYWDDAVRRPLLFDSKADILVYGMGEKAILELADSIKNEKDYDSIKGLCVISKEPVEGFVQLPPFEKVVENKKTFSDMFMTAYRNNDPLTASGMCQKVGERWLIHNPPQPLPTSIELDSIYELDYEYDAHPKCRERGEIRALETIKFSVTTHRGCYGECSFCAIAMHQGRTVISRSEDSIEREIKRFLTKKKFTGIIYDLGGPTANMYGFECEKKMKEGPCRKKRCLHPEICQNMKIDHSRQIRLLKRISNIPGVKKVFIASGVRHDLVLADKKHGTAYLKELVEKHISGQMKIAPEHIENTVLSLMGKPSQKHLRRFRELFNELNRVADKKQFLTYYFIAAHPGCTNKDMESLKDFSRRELKMKPEQIQIFTPTPSTISTLIYHTETDPYTGHNVFVEKDINRKKIQKKIMS